MIYVILDKTRMYKNALIDKIISMSNRDVLIINPIEYNYKIIEDLLTNTKDKDIIISSSFSGIINYTPPILRTLKIYIYYHNCCKKCTTPLIRLYNYNKYLKNVYPTYKEFEEFVYSIGNDWVVINLTNENNSSLMNNHLFIVNKCTVSTLTNLILKNFL